MSQRETHGRDARATTSPSLIHLLQSPLRSRRGDSLRRDPAGDVVSLNRCGHQVGEQIGRAGERGNARRGEGGSVILIEHRSAVPFTGERDRSAARQRQQRPRFCLRHVQQEAMAGFVAHNPSIRAAVSGSAWSFRRREFGCLLLLLLDTFGKPLRRPGRRRFFRHRRRLLRENEKQAQPVLAGKLAARTGAFEGRTAEINRGLVGSTAAALNRAPDASSAKAGKNLSAARKWKTRGATDVCAWGTR